MKLVYSLLIAFVALSTYAQKITEKDLLGSWHLSRFEMNGVLANLETGEANATDPALNGSPDIEYLKNMLKGPMGEKLKSNKMIFKTGGIVQMAEMDKVDEYTYTITEAGATDQLTVNSPEKIMFEAALVGGALKLSLTGSRHPTTMYFAKDK
jgi:hypothetical protein